MNLSVLSVSVFLLYTDACRITLITDCMEFDYRNYTFKLKSHAKAYKYFKFEILDNKGDACTQLAGLTLDGSIVK